MIYTCDIEERIFGFFDTIYDYNRTDFGFSSSVDESYIVDKQTEAPRPSSSTILLYRVNDNTPFGNMISVDEPEIDKTTGDESISIWRRLHVVVNILSKVKGKAKDAMAFILAAKQTTRGYDAQYSTAFDFELPLYNIDKNLRDLTELENRAWTERIEADFYFNYKDVIEFDRQPLINTPSSVENVTDIIGYTLEMK